MSYDYHHRRTVILLAERLDPGIALNVTGHLGIAAGRYADEDLMGRSILLDAAGGRHVGISKYAVIIKKARPDQIRQAIGRAQELSGLLVVEYPRQMLETGHDDELADAMERAAPESLDYLGALFYGPSGDVDAVCRKFSLWR